MIKLRNFKVDIMLHMYDTSKCRAPVYAWDQYYSKCRAPVYPYVLYAHTLLPIRIMYK